MKRLTSLFTKSKKRQNSSGDETTRDFLAESLEARILYSAAPVDAAPEAVAHETVEARADVGGGFEGISGFGEDRATSDETGINDGGLEIPQSTYFQNLTHESLLPIAEVAIDNWEASGLTAEQITALQTVEFSIVDLDGPGIGLRRR